MKKISLVVLLIFLVFPAHCGDRKNIPLPILLYHNVTNEMPASDIDLHISVDTLEAHLQMLADNGYTAIDFADYLDYRTKARPLPEKPIIITFDDGYLSNYEIAYPLLKKYNMKATIFVVTDSSNNPFSVQYPHFDWKQAREMEASGLIDIESHSYTHPLHTELTYNELYDQVMRSTSDLLINMRKEPSVYAYPNGQFTRMSQRLVNAAGYKMQVTVMRSINNDSTPLNALRRINVGDNDPASDLLRYISGDFSSTD